MSWPIHFDRFINALVTIVPGRQPVITRRGYPRSRLPISRVTGPILRSQFSQEWSNRPDCPQGLPQRSYPFTLRASSHRNLAWHRERTRFIFGHHATALPNSRTTGHLATGVPRPADGGRRLLRSPPRSPGSPTCGRPLDSGELLAPASHATSPRQAGSPQDPVWEAAGSTTGTRQSRAILASHRRL